MPNYQYVSQGEYFITLDPNTVLVTSGMTECIALALIDKNPANRLLAHIDGYILYNVERAISNLSQIINEFIQKTHSENFKIYLLGGQHKRRNNQTLRNAINALSWDITNFTDINQFCSDRNQMCNQAGAKFFSKFNPMNADATMVCAAQPEPRYVTYQPNIFSPSLSESELESGRGLLSEAEQEKYALFSAINSEILKNHPHLAQAFRTSADRQWIDDHKSLIHFQTIRKI